MELPRVDTQPGVTQEDKKINVLQNEEWLTIQRIRPTQRDDQTCSLSCSSSSL